MRRIIVLTLAFALLHAPGFISAQRNEAPPAPVPLEITTAKRVFVANGGDDPHFEGLGRSRAYNQFYAAMKEWGRYELVASPGAADLVLEISLVSQFNKYGDKFEAIPMLRLTMMDPKTHTLLWALSDDLESKGIIVGANRDSKFRKSMERIVASLKALVEQPASPRP